MRVRRSLGVAVMTGLMAGMVTFGAVGAAPINTTVVTIPNPTPAADAQFGFAVEPTGDVTADGVADFAVGAPGADRVDVYSGATRTRIRSIVDPENQPGNNFGYSLADVGDVNGDGVADLAVGARGIDNSFPLPCVMPPCTPTPDQGRAFVFSGTTGALIRKLSPADTNFLAFGFALAGLGDVSGDGVPDIAVGAPTLINNKIGQVFAFSGANGSVLWIANEPPQPLASFGSSLTSVADHNGDGKRDLIVGAYFDDIDPGPTDTLVGRAYLSSGATGAEIRHHDNPLGAAGVNFGFASSPLGDQTADGVEDYAISDPGAARVHTFNGATGALLGTIATPGASTDDFGMDLSTTEDRSGDGKRDLWVGAPKAGKVYLVNGSGTVLLTIADPTPGGSPSFLGFGFALASTANLGGDAGSDLLIGEPAEASESGAVHLLLVAANRPPTADAGATVTAECTGPGGASVTLDGSASSDPDGDALSYEWRDATSAVVGTTAVVTLAVPLGSHVFTLKVSDGFGGVDTDTVTVNVVDTSAPTVTVTLSPNRLWPPDHRLVQITATVTANDLCAGALPSVLDSITSSEPDNGLGDGDKAGDISGAALGTSDTTFALRAERSGSGPGRVYTVTYRVTGPSGNAGTASAVVRVPSSGPN
jgi:FG-GAP repeat